jgi:hypothetical protein
VCTHTNDTFLAVLYLSRTWLTWPIRRLANRLQDEFASARGLGLSVTIIEESHLSEDGAPSCAYRNVEVVSQLCWCMVLELVRDSGEGQFQNCQRTIRSDNLWH